MYEISDEMVDKIKSIVEEFPNDFKNIERIDVSWVINSDNMIFKVTEEGGKSSYTIVKNIK